MPRRCKRNQKQILLNMPSATRFRNVCKYTKTRPIMDGFRKNNVNYWVFREIRSIIPHL